MRGTRQRGRTAWNVYGCGLLNAHRRHVVLYRELVIPSYNFYRDSVAKSLSIKKIQMMFSTISNLINFGRPKIRNMDGAGEGGLSFLIEKNSADF